jgi:hypothetical protein
MYVIINVFEMRLDVLLCFGLCIIGAFCSYNFNKIMFN